MTRLMAVTPLFHRLYGNALTLLPGPIVKLHDISRPRTWHGEAQVSQGDSFASRLVCRTLGFPPPAERVTLSVAMEPDAGGEIWQRAFGPHLMTTQHRAGRLPRTVEETVWPLTAISRLDADADGVTQVLVGLRLLGLPLPRALWPRLEVRESAEGTRYRFSVRAAFPWGAPIGKYEGWLQTDTPRHARP
jgi:hypothetical protein